MDSQVFSKIRRLGKYEIGMGIELFAESIPRHWPNTADEARKWVEAEFRHPEAVVIGHFDGTLLDAVACLTSFEFVLSNLRSHEKRLIQGAFKKAFPTLSCSQAAHVGGLAVSEEVERNGLGTLLFNLIKREARARRYVLQIGHIARQNSEYPSLRVLESIVKRQNFRELPVAEKIFYPRLSKLGPPNLEKVWCYKPC